MKHQPLFELLSNLIESCCAHPQQLRIFTETVNGTAVLTVLPHTADYPKLVGRHGRQVNAFKYLVQQAAGTLGASLDFVLKESFLGEREPSDPFIFNPDFDVAEFERLLQSLADLCAGEPVPVAIKEHHEILHVTATVPRGHRHETLLQALDAVCYAYCYKNGRKLQLKPHYLNPQP